VCGGAGIPPPPPPFTVHGRQGHRRMASEGKWDGPEGKEGGKEDEAHDPEEPELLFRIEGPETSPTWNGCFNILSAYRPSDGGETRIAAEMGGRLNIGVWDTATGELLTTVGAPDGVTAVATVVRFVAAIFTYEMPGSGAPRIAVGYAWGGVRLLDGDDYSVVADVHAVDGSAAFLASYLDPRDHGRVKLVVACGRPGGTQIQILDGATGERVSRPRPLDGDLTALATFSTPDGEEAFLAVGGYQGEVRVYFLHERDAIHDLPGHPRTNVVHPVHGLAFFQAPSGVVHVVSASEDLTAKVWDLRTLVLVASIELGHRGRQVIAWQELDGRSRFVSVGAYGKIKV
jgi:hypothetical protein